MRRWRSRVVGISVAAALLASLLGTPLAGTTYAYSIGNANPSVAVPVGTPTPIGIAYTWSGNGSGDAIGPVGTTFVVTLPSGYSWTVLPAIVPTPASAIVFSGPVASAGGLVRTWTLTSFAPTAAWSIALTGGTVLASGQAGSGPIALQVGSGAAVQIAYLTSRVSAGTAVPLTVTPLAVPADGDGTVQLTFGTPTISCANAAAFTVTTTAGTFTTFPGVTGVTNPVNAASVTVPCSGFSSVAGKVLTLRAPTVAGAATLTVTLAGATTADSATLVTFTPLEVTPSTVIPGANGRGARKVVFYEGSASGTCAAAPAAPPAGAKSYGFAIVTVTGNGRINVQVSLKGALPNATYSLAVRQAPGSCSSSLTIRTNARGNGNGHVRLAVSSGVTQVWVTATSGTSVLVTKAALVAVKAHGPKHNVEGNGNGKSKGQDED